MNPRYAVPAEEVASLRRHLWLRRGSLAVALVVAALFFVSQTKQLVPADAISAIAIFVIFCAGGMRRIKAQVDRLRLFELWLEPERVRFVDVDGERQQFLRSDIASVEERGLGLVIRRTSAPNFILTIPRQIERYDELVSELKRHQ